MFTIAFVSVLAASGSTVQEKSNDSPVFVVESLAQGSGTVKYYRNASDMPVNARKDSKHGSK